MKTIRNYIAFIAAFIILALPACADDTADAALTSFFKSLESGNYAQCWSLLSQSSKDDIAESVYDEYKSILENDNSEASQKVQQKLSLDFMYVLFSEGNDPYIIQPYWQTVSKFFPLANQQWVYIADFGEDQECILGRKLSDTDGFHMIKEDGEWKVCFLKEQTAEDALRLFYNSLNTGNYAQSWAFLTEESKESVVQDVLNSLDILGQEDSEEAIQIRKMREMLNEENVRLLFTEVQANDENDLAALFWLGFCELNYKQKGLSLKKLSQQKWLHMADSADGNTCVLSTDINGTNEMHMFKVDGQWKVGLSESGCLK